MILTSFGGNVPSSNTKSMTLIPSALSSSTLYVGSQTLTTSLTLCFFSSYWDIKFILNPFCKIYWYPFINNGKELTWIKVWMVWSLGRSVMRNFIFLYSISAGSGLMSFTLMLLISFLDNKWCKTPTIFMFLTILYDTVSLYFCNVPHYTKQQRLNLRT